MAALGSFYEQREASESVIINELEHDIKRSGEANKDYEEAEDENNRGSLNDYFDEEDNYWLFSTNHDQIITTPFHL